MHHRQGRRTDGYRLTPEWQVGFDPQALLDTDFREEDFAPRRQTAQKRPVIRDEVEAFQFGLDFLADFVFLLSGEGFLILSRVVNHVAGEEEGAPILACLFGFTFTGCICISITACSRNLFFDRLDANPYILFAHTKRFENFQLGQRRG